MYKKYYTVKIYITNHINLLKPLFCFECISVNVTGIMYFVLFIGAFLICVFY